MFLPGILSMFAALRLFPWWGGARNSYPSVPRSFVTLIDNSLDVGWFVLARLPFWGSVTAFCLVSFCLKDPHPVCQFMVLVPFKMRPSFVSFIGSFVSLILFGMFAVVMSLFLTLSQALEKHKPFSCLCFPLCFFIPAAFSHFDPYVKADTYTNSSFPRLFFCIRRLVGCGVFFFVLSLFGHRCYACIC